jgi:hypothetical protein
LKRDEIGNLSGKHDERLNDVEATGLEQADHD